MKDIISLLIIYNEFRYILVNHNHITINKDIKSRYVSLIQFILFILLLLYLM